MSDVSGGAVGQYDTSPDAALAAVATYDGSILVDFDETLYLRNSTEDFIDCARPAILALLLLRLLDGIKPWRLTGSNTRDTWRVCAISVFFPWIWWIWHTRVPHLAERYANNPLREALKARTEPPIVLTVGFEPVVAPLLAAMGLGNLQLVAARVISFADRRMGKLHLATRDLGAHTVGRSMVITDSANDLDVLRSCARPLHTVWPQAHYRQALSDVYVPGQYISRIKRPGTRYIWRSVLQEDYAFWVLCSIGLAVDPVAHVAGLLLLLLSFWSIYERGYVDNDLAALRHEVDPALSKNVGRVSVATPVLQPWVWALLSGAAGVGILHPNLEHSPIYFLLWTAVLVLTHISFYYYNIFDKQTRVWLYALLQLWRSAAFVAVVPIEPVGVAALGALMTARWIPYIAYRLRTASNWPEMPASLIRLIIFILLSAILACAVPATSVLTWSALALLLWNVFRARGDIRAALKVAHRLDRSRE